MRIKRGVKKPTYNLKGIFENCHNIIHILFVYQNITEDYNVLKLKHYINLSN